MTQPVKILAQARFKPGIFHSQGRHLNHYTNKAVELTYLSAFTVPGITHTTWEEICPIIIIITIINSMSHSYPFPFLCDGPLQNNPVPTQYITCCPLNHFNLTLTHSNIPEPHGQCRQGWSSQWPCGCIWLVVPSAPETECHSSLPWVERLFCLLSAPLSHAEPPSLCGSSQSGTKVKNTQVECTQMEHSSLPIVGTVKQVHLLPWNIRLNSWFLFIHKDGIWLPLWLD